MPLRVLSEEERRAFDKRKSHIDLTPYEEELRRLPAGAWAELIPEDGESMRTL